MQIYFFVLGGILFLGIVMLAWFVFTLRRKMKLILGGAEKPEGDLPQDLLRRIIKAEIKLEEMEPRLGLVEKISKISVQKVGFLRFNPFDDTGSDQSFILVLLDRENNGIVISSLYAREGVRIYAKSVTGGKSGHPLSEEEKTVLEQTIHKQ